MNTATAHDETTLGMLQDFFRSHDIRSIRISRAADIRDTEVSQVEISFGGGAESDSQTYEVTFKVLDRASDTHRYLGGIGPAPGFALELNDLGKELGRDEIGSRVSAFIRAIESRVAKVHKEQSILGTRPLGKTFLLYNKTRFEVLADNGEGQLVIKIIRKDGSDEASLSANDLLDGLYSGAITEA